jgi:hypothetical protein
VIEMLENDDETVRIALDRHWAASEAGDFQAEHDIYHEDAILEYPQSGERIRGRRNIQLTRSRQENKKRFLIRRVLGSGALWITEYILSYDGEPYHTVSIMEFRERKVARETQYFGSPFEPSAWRAPWVELFKTGSPADAGVIAAPAPPVAPNRAGSSG